MSRVIAALLALAVGALPTRASAALDPLLQWTVVTESVAPTSGAAMAIDGPGRIAYLFGGVRPGVGLCADVVRTDLASPNVAWEVVASGEGPSARQDAHGHFDVATGRLIVLGGRVPPATFLSDAWALEPGSGTWTSLATPTLGPARIHRAQPLVHDRRRNRLLYFEEFVDVAPTRVWALDLAAPTPDWSSLTMTGSPIATSGSSAAYDSLGDRVFVLGPEKFLQSFDLDTNTWSTAIPPASCPFSNTSDLALAVDEATNTLIARRFVSDYATNAKAIVALSMPPAWVTRWDAEGPEFGWRPWAHDRVAGRVIVQQEVGNIPFLYEMSTGPDLAWTHRVPRDRPTSMGYANAADLENRWWYLLEWGGSRLFRAHLDDLGRFEELAPTGAPPAPRRGMAAAWDSTGNRILFSGGTDVATGVVQVDVRALELGATPHWITVPTLTAGPPHALCGALDATRRLCYVTAINGFRQDLWRLDLAQSPAVWTKLLELLPTEPLAIAVDRGGERLRCAGGRYGFVVDLTATPPTAGPLIERPIGAGWPSTASIAFDPRRSRLYVHRGSTRFSNTGVAKSDETDAFGGPGTTATFVNAGVTNELITPATGSDALFDPRRDRMILLNGWLRGYDPSGYPTLFPQLGLWTLQFDPAVPARMDLVDASAEAGGIRVRFAGEGWTGDVEVERTEAAIDGWERIGMAIEITPGTLEFVDHAVLPGSSYRYRGRFFDETGERVTAPSAEVRLGDGTTAFALAVHGGAIVRGTALEFDIAFAASGPATLDVFDVRGRRMGGIALEGIAGETRRVSIAPPGGLSSGLFFARLRQGADERRARFIRL